MTGKNKEQFERWWYKNIDFVALWVFYELPFEMQISVYLAYYDSIDYVIDVMYIFAFKQYTFELENKEGSLGLPYKENLFNSRNEAYKEAFKEADKLINNE